MGKNTPKGRYEEVDHDNLYAENNGPEAEYSDYREREDPHHPGKRYPENGIIWPAPIKPAPYPFARDDRSPLHDRAEEKD